MKRRELKEILRKEVAKWSKQSYHEMCQLDYPWVKDIGEGEVLYNVELDKLEDEPEYVHISISVCDTGLSTFFPVSTSIIFRSDGTVDAPEV
ncbi:MAG: hypothetical protein KAT79_06450 [candidate division Zixibacteria bacterium]|nr:hypothetical protein [candidate division Zixibacteria bacterium]